MLLGEWHCKSQDTSIHITDLGCSKVGLYESKCRSFKTYTHNAGMLEATAERHSIQFSRFS
jgi:hypothetical protein